MAGKPFKVGAQPGAHEKGAGKIAPRPSFNAAESSKHAAAEGETLFEAGVENMQPDFELDSSVPDDAAQGHGEGHAQRPAYKPANPWPADKPVAHKPFKL